MRTEGMPLEGGDAYATWDAAYVLGALSVADRREFEGHLRACSLCHRSVEELAGMPALLGQLSRDDMEPIDESRHVAGEMPPPQSEVLGSLLDTVRRRRRRTRLLALTGGCVAAAAAATVVVVAFRPSPMAPAPAPQAGASTSMTAVTPSPLTATFSLVSHSWGTGIEMNCTYHPEVPAESDDDGDRLAMVAVGRDGSHDQVATWIARSGTTASPTGSTSLPIDEIASVQVISADTGNVFLERSP